MGGAYHHGHAKGPRSLAGGEFWFKIVFATMVCASVLCSKVGGKIDGGPSRVLHVNLFDALFLHTTR